MELPSVVRHRPRTLALLAAEAGLALLTVYAVVPEGTSETCSFDELDQWRWIGWGMFASLPVTWLLMAPRHRWTRCVGRLTAGVRATLAATLLALMLIDGGFGFC